MLTPKGALAWVLTAAAGLLAVITATLAICMYYPIRWDGLGIVGALALLFPLHLLVFAVLAALLTYLADRCEAKLAAWMFGFVLIMTTVMALTPTIAVWQRARGLNVQLSLATYLAQATHLNKGGPQLDRSVAYGKAADGTKLELDVWRTSRPNTGPLRPAIVLVHGGAWIHGTRSMFPEWDFWFNELGYEVFDVEYRLPPVAGWQDEIGDVKSALGWVGAHAGEYHVDPARISVMGNSAGANLALLAAYSAGDPQLPPSTDVPAVAARSVINLYGPSDLALGYRCDKSAAYVRSAMRTYLGGTPEEFPERYRALSPLSHIGPHTPPTLTILGTSDRIVATEQADVLAQALARAGVPHETYFLPGNDHGFDVNWGGFGTQIARARIRDFLDRYDGPQPAGSDPR